MFTTVKICLIFKEKLYYEYFNTLSTRAWTYLNKIKKKCILTYLLMNFLYQVIYYNLFIKLITVKSIRYYLCVKRKISNFFYYDI